MSGKSKFTKLNEGLTTLAVAAFIFVCICLGIVLLHVNKTLYATDAVTQKVSVEIDRLDTTRKTIDDLLVQTTTLITDADNTETQESEMLKNVNGQLVKVIANVNTSVQALTTNQNDVVKHVDQSVDALTTQINNLQGTDTQLNKAIGDVDQAVLDTRTLIDNPAIPQTLQNVQSLTKESADTMQHMNSTSKDVQSFVHSWVYPTWAHRVKDFVFNSGVSIAKFFF